VVYLKVGVTTEKDTVDLTLTLPLIVPQSRGYNREGHMRQEFDESPANPCFDYFLDSFVRTVRQIGECPGGVSDHLFIVGVKHVRQCRESRQHLPHTNQMRVSDRVSCGPIPSPIRPMWIGLGMSYVIRLANKTYPLKLWLRFSSAEI